jgi:hypothetical protein
MTAGFILTLSELVLSAFVNLTQVGWNAEGLSLGDVPLILVLAVVISCRINGTA